MAPRFLDHVAENPKRDAHWGIASDAASPLPDPSPREVRLRAATHHMHARGGIGSGGSRRAFIRSCARVREASV